jgi:hypothetical protein
MKQEREEKEQTHKIKSNENQNAIDKTKGDMI